MRIVHVTDVYAPRVGGIERQIAMLVRAQRAQGHDVRVLAPEGDGVERQWGDPDVVHGHLSVVSPFTVGRLRDATASGIPTAMTVHSMWPTHPALTASGRFAIGVLGLVGAWGAVSEVAAERVRGLLPPGTRVAVAPNGVDVGWWARPRARRTRAGRTVHAVLVNRLTTRKRVLPLLAAVARTGVAELRLTIVGDGPQRGRLQRFVQRHGLEGSVRLVGSLPSPAVREVLHRADLFLAPADQESFGIAALEARAAGVPVIGRSGSGVADLVTPGVDGLTVADEDAMAGAVADLVRRRAILAAMQFAAWRTPPVAGIDESVAATAALYASAGVPLAGGRAVLVAS